jgi:hypothetical protein
VSAQSPLVKYSAINLGRTTATPAISANAEKRDEGFFRLEWSEACERDRAIQGRRFILLVVVDDDYGGDPTGYVLIPDRFRKYQFRHAPSGVLPERLLDELIAQIRALRRPESA